MTYLEQFNCETIQEKPKTASTPNIVNQKKVALMSKDNYSSCDSKSSKDNVSRHPQGSNSNMQVKSALDIESITIIDECDEGEEMYSPNRLNQNMSFNFESHD